MAAPICRLCFKESKRLYKITGTAFAERENILSKLINVVCNNVVSFVNAESKMCKCCRTQIEKFNSFKEMVMKNLELDIIDSDSVDNVMKTPCRSTSQHAELAESVEKMTIDCRQSKKRLMFTPTGLTPHEKRSCNVSDGDKHGESSSGDCRNFPSNQDLTTVDAADTMEKLISHEHSYMLQDTRPFGRSPKKSVAFWISETTSAAKGADLRKLKVPVGGDQLTRVRLQGAKALRAGAHEPHERFDQLEPMVVELFHTVMDFLEKLTKKFMKANSGRDKGTLGNLKVRIQRTSVNGNVKSRYSAHEDFVLIVGRAYFLEYAMTYFQMEDRNSIPITTEPIPENISKCHEKTRERLFQAIFPDLARHVVGNCILGQPEIAVLVNGVEIKVPVNNDNALVKLQVANKQYPVTVPCSSLAAKKVVVIQLPGNVTVSLKQKDDDDLHNYSSQFLHWYAILLSMRDAIHEGNIYMVNIILKMMVPCFYLHSDLSKYLVECVDFILKTEHLLESKLALQVRLSAMVNPSGGQGRNKAADLEKENQVKEIKKLIKGLGANKTENSIVRISKAAPVISDIVHHVDDLTGFRHVKTRHKSRCEDEDLETLSKSLRDIEPFKYKPGRYLIHYRGICGNVYHELSFKRLPFTNCLTNIVERLRRNFPVEQDEDEI